MSFFLFFFCFPFFFVLFLFLETQHHVLPFKLGRPRHGQLVPFLPDGTCDMPGGASKESRAFQPLLPHIGTGVLRGFVQLQVAFLDPIQVLLFTLCPDKSLDFLRSV